MMRFQGRSRALAADPTGIGYLVAWVSFATLAILAGYKKTSPARRAPERHIERK